MYTHAYRVYVCMYIYICTSRAYPAYELVLTLFKKIPSGMHIQVFDCDFLGILTGDMFLISFMQITTPPESGLRIV